MPPLTAEQKAIEAARSDLLAYCLLMNPHFIVGPHHRLIADKLNAVNRGEIDRLMIFMPPRSGKSLMTSIYLPSWELGLNPNWELMAIAYSGELAKDWGREVRNTVGSAKYQEIFDVALRADSQAAGRWHTDAGGVYISAGIDSGIAGRGANLAIVDDPLSEQDSFSATAREKVIKWYPGGLLSRTMPEGRIVITNTRWHDEDLSGHLLRLAKKEEDADNWEILSIPALVDAESAEMLEEARDRLVSQGILEQNYPHFEIGSSYWPRNPNLIGKKSKAKIKGWSADELKRKKANMPNYQWQALYQQNPIPEGGGILKKQWWREWLGERPPHCQYILISADTAFSTKETADFSVFTVWGVFYEEGKVYPSMILLSMEKGRWTFPELKAMAHKLNNYYEPDAFLIEKKASGQSLIQELNVSGVPVIPWVTDKDKVARAHACSPIFQNGRIWRTTHKWADEVVDECAAFPNAPHDDITDTVTQATLWLRIGSWIRTTDDPPDEQSTEKKVTRYY